MVVIVSYISSTSDVGWIKTLPYDMVAFVEDEALIESLKNLREGMLDKTTFIINNQITTYTQYVLEASEIYTNDVLVWVDSMVGNKIGPWIENISSDTIMRTEECDIAVGTLEAWKQGVETIDDMIPNPFLEIDTVSMIDDGNIFTNRDTRSLCEIMEVYNCSKGNSNGDALHTYTPIYHNILKHMRNKPIKLIEFGKNISASLQGWKDYFPNGIIYGYEMNNRLPLLNKHMIYSSYFEDEKWTSADSEERELLPQYDIIIENGYHTFYDSCHLFEIIHDQNFLKTDGFYMIEDIHRRNYDLFKSKIQQWMEQWPGYYSYSMYNLLPHEKRYFVDDNIVLIIKRLNH